MVIDEYNMVYKTRKELMAEKRRISKYFSKRRIAPYRKMKSIPISIPSIMRKLVYVERVNFASAVISEQLFRLNSLYDPNDTGVGDQPLVHDQYLTMYRRYRVYGAKVEVFADNRGSETTVFAIYANANGNSDATLDAACERPGAIIKTLAPQSDNVCLARRYYPIYKLSGVRKSEVALDNQYAADMGANPANNTFLHLVAGSFDGASNVDVNCVVRITFITKLFERVMVAES